MKSVIAFIVLVAYLFLGTKLHLLAFEYLRELIKGEQE